MPEKYLRITMPDGSKWDVPARLVAENRAKYYAEKNPDNPSQSTYEEEFEYAMSDDYELKDWAAGNMDWEDVEEFAVRHLGPDDPDYQEGWVNGEKEIVVK